MFLERENKTNPIHIRVTAKQKQTVTDMAKERGMTVSEMILRLLENELKNPQIKGGK